MSKYYLYIFIAVVITLGFWAATGLKFETNITAYNLAADEDIAAYESFIEALTPNEGDASIIILEKESGWHTLADFQLLDEITLNWETLSEIEKTTSLANLRYPKQGVFLPTSVPFFDLKRPDRFQRRMEQLDNYTDIVSKFLSENKRYTLVFATVPKDISKTLAVQLSQSVEQYKDVNTHLVSYDQIQEELQSILRKDTILLATISLCLILLGFYAFTKSLRGLALIGMMVAFNIALTFIAMYALSMPFTLHMITIPCIVIVLSFTDIMHILYHQQIEYATTTTDRELRNNILNAVRIPLLLTSLTNIVGFLFFLFFAENIHLFHFSLAAILGVTIAYLSSRFIVVQLMDRHFIYIKRTRFDQLYTIHNSGSNWFWRRKNYILPLFIFATVLLIILVSLNLKIDSSEQEYALTSSKLTAGQSILQHEFFGAKQAEVLVTVEKGAVWDKESLDQLDEIEVAIERVFQPLFINSPTTIVKRYHRYLSNGQPDAFYIPHRMNKKYTAQLNQFRSQLGGNGIIDTTATKARIVFGFPSRTLSEARHAYEQIRSILEGKNTRNIRFELSGLQYLSDQATHAFSLKILLSFLLSILFGSLFVYAFLKSVRKSLGVLLVNLFPMFFALGIMLYWQLAITPFTLFFLSILLGICVDDSIYLITQHRKGGKSFYVVPIFITSFVLSLGFLSLAFSYFAWIQPFGWIFLVGIAMAYILDFFVLPLFLKNASE